MFSFLPSIQLSFSPFLPFCPPPAPAFPLRLEPEEAGRVDGRKESWEGAERGRVLREWIFFFARSLPLPPLPPLREGWEREGTVGR